MLHEYGCHILLSRKPSIARRLQSPIDSIELIRGRMVRAARQSGVDLLRDSGKLLLYRFRPSLNPQQNVLECLCCHTANHIMFGYCPQLQFRMLRPTKASNG